MLFGSLKKLLVVVNASFKNKLNTAIEGFSSKSRGNLKMFSFGALLLNNLNNNLWPLFKAVNRSRL